MLPRKKADRTPSGNGSAFEFPPVPYSIPEWAGMKALPWQGLTPKEVEIVTQKETGRKLEIRDEDLPDSLWGLHVARGERVRIFVNRNLPPFWQRFALFHELFHVLEHRRGEEFWNRTATPMSSFESQADLFAWAVVIAENGHGGHP